MHNKRVFTLCQHVMWQCPPATMCAHTHTHTHIFLFQTHTPPVSAGLLRASRACVVQQLRSFDVTSRHILVNAFTELVKRGDVPYLTNPITAPPRRADSRRSKWNAVCVCLCAFLGWRFDRGVSRILQSGVSIHVLTVSCPNYVRLLTIIERAALHIIL